MKLAICTVVAATILGGIGVSRLIRRREDRKWKKTRVHVLYNDQPANREVKEDMWASINDAQERTEPATIYMLTKDINVGKRMEQAFARRGYIVDLVPLSSLLSSSVGLPTAISEGYDRVHQVVLTPDTPTNCVPYHTVNYYSKPVLSQS